MARITDYYRKFLKLFSAGNSKISVNSDQGKLTSQFCFLNTTVKYADSVVEFYFEAKSIVFMLFKDENTNKIKFTKQHEESDELFVHFINVSKVEISSFKIIDDPKQISTISWTFPDSLFKSGPALEFIIPLKDLHDVDFREISKSLNPEQMGDSLKNLSRWKRIKSSINLSIDFEVCKSWALELPSHCDYNLSFTRFYK